MTGMGLTELNWIRWSLEKNLSQIHDALWLWIWFSLSLLFCN